MSKHRVLQIEAWCDGQSCPECGSSNIMEQVSKNGMICASCGHVFEDHEGLNWTWNNWHHVNDYDTEVHGKISEENFLTYLIPDPEHHRLYQVRDDQANLVIKRKKDGCPYFALEYYREHKEEN
jgi:transcription initiation factor TFIIIB Brf1 subunit/transcription initiation factor TFIIB